MTQRPNIKIYAEDLPNDFTYTGKSIAIDTETAGLNIKRDRLCLAQLGDGNGNVWLVKFSGEKYNAPNLCKLLADERIEKMYHYARFDIAVMNHYLGTMSQNNYCTKIASKLVRTYTDRHGLKALVEEFTGVELNKEEQCSDWAAEELTEAQKHYAASDVMYLHKIRAGLDTRLNDTGRMAIAQKCFEFLPTRTALDLLGWTNDIFSHNA